MSRLRYFLTDYRTLTALALLVAGATLFLGVDGAKRVGFQVLVAGVLLALAWLVVWAVRRHRARRAEARLDGMLRDQADAAVAQATPAARADTEILRGKMLDAVKAIKGSRLGHARGSAALYELPWYVIIGNPAAGKSTAVLNSGLQFPFEESRQNVVHGIGGTRNCDWYFTTEGIVLDTAGRYSVSLEDRLDWLTFLDLLRGNRPMAPINGVIIAVSIAELAGSKPEFAIDLAKNLRHRVQELTERLEVFAPVYVVFTKADLIAGFSEFFSTLDPAERENGWGATLPYDAQGESDALAAFDAHFDILSDGLKELALSQLGMRRGHESGPALLTLPLEFAAIKPALRTFIATLFEENPYQFKPVFRGFYFTSALQEGTSVHRASERIAQRFDLALAPPPVAAAAEGDGGSGAQLGYFLQGLFRKVVFADRQLVRQYSSPRRSRMRQAAFLAAAVVLAAVLAGWTWSYTANRQFAANVAADLDKAVQVQQDRVDLKSRIEALLILQQRLEQLAQYRQDRPLALGLGLYQGDRIEEKVRREYFNGMRQIMLQPTTQRIEDFLGAVVANGDGLRGGEAPKAEAAQQDTLYQDASPARADDAYAALKAYLMLGDRSRVEFSALTSELTRFWRGWLEANRGQMTREEMIRDAERLMSFHVAQASVPDWPQIEPKFALVDDTRGLLREVMKGKPAVERVYGDVKTRAATRFPTITVDYLVGQDLNKGAVTGNYAISGAFSRAAWDGYVKDAISEAANTQLSTSDWVLETTAATDLTIAGSPEHIAQELTGMYKTEYAREWRRFVDAVAVAEFPDLDTAATRMDSIGDARNSPLRKLLVAVNDHTVWDNPVAQGELADKAREGLIGWFERVIMRRNPTSIPVRIDPQTGRQEPVPPGPVGREFAGLARLLAKRDGNPPVLDAYFESLGKVRTRLNGIRTRGAPGADASRLMQDTLAGSGSELSEALRLVDEQMLEGVDEAQRGSLRNLLLRPLTQTWAALVAPTEAELNHIWAAQVQQPFATGIGQRYPFTASATVEAVQADIEQVFGPSGSIAVFSKDTLGSLVTRRGNALEPARWAGLGISLSPEFTSGYASWVAPLGQVASSGGGGGAAQQMFRIQPQPASGLNEYTIEIDGQALRYRNTPPQWQTFRWPGPGTPGARVFAVNASGQVVELLNAPGNQGLGRLFEAAEQRTLGEGHYQLTWQAPGSPAVTVELELIAASVASSAGGGSAAGLTTGSMRGLRLPATITASPPAPPAPGGAGTAEARP